MLEKQVSNDFSWKKLNFEEKRHLSGFKIRMLWSTRDMYAHVKFSFNSEFFQLNNPIAEGSIVAELE